MRYLLRKMDFGVDRTAAVCYNISCRFGLLAQLVEHIVHIDGVTGSSPVQTTKDAKYSRMILAVLGVFFLFSSDRFEEDGYGRKAEGNSGALVCAYI